MAEERTWEEFVSCGLTWWINRSLHLFGWAIQYEVNEAGRITRGYPVRCSYRGFSEADEDAGFERLTKFLAKNSGQLLDDLKEDDNG